MVSGASRICGEIEKDCKLPCGGWPIPVPSKALVGEGRASKYIGMFHKINHVSSLIHHHQASLIIERTFGPIQKKTIRVSERGLAC